MNDVINVLEIYDRDDEVPKVLCNALPSLLELIKHYADELVWSVHFFEICGGWELPYSYHEIVKRTSRPGGWKVKWSELIEFSNKNGVPIDLTLIGEKQYGTIDIGNLWCRAELESIDTVIELFDSTYWRFYTSDESLMDKVEASFSVVKKIEIKN